MIYNTGKENPDQDISQNIKEEYMMDEKNVKAAGNETMNESEDSQQPAWHCDIYCRKIRHVSCEGEKYVKSDAEMLCPYYDEMLY